MQATHPPATMDLQGIPKRTLPDDTAQYSLYILDSKQHLHARLTKVQDAAKEILRDWGRDYIWQREGFGLDIAECDGTFFDLVPLRAVTYEYARTSILDWTNRVWRLRRRRVVHCCIITRTE